jgi:hypothetical protein
LQAPISCDTFESVVVVVNSLKPFTHASVPVFGEPLPGAVVNGFFHFHFAFRTPHDSRGRKWGRSEENRDTVCNRVIECWLWKEQTLVGRGNRGL